MSSCREESERSFALYQILRPLSFQDPTESQLHKLCCEHLQWSDIRIYNPDVLSESQLINLSEFLRIKGNFFFDWFYITISKQSTYERSFLVQLAFDNLLGQKEIYLATRKVHGIIEDFTRIHCWKYCLHSANPFNWQNCTQ